MVSQDSAGRIWHRGTQIGIIYMCVAIVWLGVTMTQDPDGPYSWLSKFGFSVVLLPLAAASHGYAIADRERVQKQKDATESAD